MTKELGEETTTCIVLSGPGPSQMHFRKLGCLLTWIAKVEKDIQGGEDVKRNDDVVRTQKALLTLIFLCSEEVNNPNLPASYTSH